MGKLRRLVVLVPLFALGCSDGAAGPVDPGGDASDGSTDVALFETEEPTTPDQAPDAAPTTSDAPDALTIGGKARVTATALNLRSGAGTSNSILLTMPCGSLVSVVGGPQTGWWNVTYSGTTGWASGTYLVPEAAFDASVCAGATGDAGAPETGPTTAAVADILARAKSGVGYSYYWGHGSWGTDGKNAGSCSGSCPSCTHSGAYGADCSGYVAKCWQIPSPSPITTDLHPYSTYNFFNDTTHWSKVDRKSVQPMDALVYNANGAGHILLFESGADPWGSIWTYEARGCSYGIVHNLRTAGSQYIAIRRE